jgi:hypothetical protein
VGKQSDAKRKAKLKARRKSFEAAEARARATSAKVATFFAAHDAEPNIVAELLDEHGALLAYIEGRDDESWTVVVDDEPVAGSTDLMASLGMFLTAAVDDRADGNTSHMQFSPWLLEEIQSRCDAANVEWTEFLLSLLPAEKRQMKLPEQRAF